MENKFYVIFTLLLFCIYLSPTRLSGKNKYTPKFASFLPEAGGRFNSCNSHFNKNLIAWDETANDNIKYFNIYRLATDPENGWITVGKAMIPGN